MNLRTFLTIAAVIALGYALGLLLMPAFMATTYGFGTSASEILLARYFGVELLVLGVINWMAKDFSAANARPIITGSLIGNIVGTYFAFMNARRCDEFSRLVGSRSLSSARAWICLFPVHGPSQITYIRFVCRSRKSDI